MRFVLVDRILTLEPGVKATGTKTIAPDEEYFQDHFPGYPVVPGVLLLEAMAQLGGRLVEASIRAQGGAEVLPVLGMIQQARFQRPVRPGERLDLASDLVSLREQAARVRGQVTVDGVPAASAEITYVLLRLGEATAGVSAEDAERLRSWSRRVWTELTGHTGPGPGPDQPR